MNSSVSIPFFSSAAWDYIGFGFCVTLVAVGMFYAIKVGLERNK